MKEKDIITKELLDYLFYINLENGLVHHKNCKKERLNGQQVKNPDDKGYYRAHFTINGKRYKVFIHRLLFFYKHGYFPEFVDHKNRIRTDNREENLREATSAENAANTRKETRNTTGYKNIHRQKGKIKVVIHKDGKNHYFGIFDEDQLDKAIEIRDNALRQLHGDFANCDGV